MSFSPPLDVIRWLALPPSLYEYRFVPEKSYFFYPRSNRPTLLVPSDLQAPHHDLSFGNYSYLATKPRKHTKWSSLYSSQPRHRRLSCSPVECGRRLSDLLLLLDELSQSVSFSDALLAQQYQPFLCYHYIYYRFSQNLCATVLGFLNLRFSDADRISIHLRGRMAAFRRLRAPPRIWFEIFTALW